MAGEAGGRGDGRRPPDEPWARMGPLLPPRPPRPPGRRDPGVPDRAAMDAIFLVPRAGRRRNAPAATGIRSSPSAHRRSLEGTEAWVSHEARRRGLPAHDAAAGTDRAWPALDGAAGEAPPGGERNRP